MPPYLLLSGPLPADRCLSFQCGASLGVVAVGPERARDGELAELVADHGLADEHRHVLASVVHGDGVPHHLGDHRRPPRPRLDDPLVAPTVHLDHLGHQVVIDERPLLDRTWHWLASPLSAAAHDELVGGLRLARAALGLPPRRGGIAPAAGLSLAAA